MLNRLCRFGDEVVKIPACSFLAPCGPGSIKGLRREKLGGNLFGEELSSGELLPHISQGEGQGVGGVGA